MKFTMQTYSSWLRGTDVLKLTAHRALDEANVASDGDRPAPASCASITLGWVAVLHTIVDRAGEIARSACSRTSGPRCVSIVQRVAECCALALELCARSVSLLYHSSAVSGAVLDFSTIASSGPALQALARDSLRPAITKAVVCMRMAVALAEGLSAVHAATATDGSRATSSLKRKLGRALSMLADVASLLGDTSTASSLLAEAAAPCRSSLTGSMLLTITSIRAHLRARADSPSQATTLSQIRQLVSLASSDASLQLPICQAVAVIVEEVVSRHGASAASLDVAGQAIQSCKASCPLHVAVVQARLLSALVAIACRAQPHAASLCGTSSSPASVPAATEICAAFARASLFGCRLLSAHCSGDARLGRAALGSVRAQLLRLDKAGEIHVPRGDRIRVLQHVLQAVPEAESGLLVAVQLRLMALLVRGDETAAEGVEAAVARITAGSEAVWDADATSAALLCLLHGAPTKAWLRPAADAVAQCLALRVSQDPSGADPARQGSVLTGLAVAGLISPAVCLAEALEPTDGSWSSDGVVTASVAAVAGLVRDEAALGAVAPAMRFALLACKAQLRQPASKPPTEARPLAVWHALAWLCRLLFSWPELLDAARSEAGLVLQLACSRCGNAGDGLGAICQALLPGWKATQADHGSGLAMTGTNVFSGALAAALLQRFSHLVWSRAGQSGSPSESIATALQLSRLLRAAECVIGAVRSGASVTSLRRQCHALRAAVHQSHASEPSTVSTSASAAVAAAVEPASEIRVGRLVWAVGRSVAACADPERRALGLELLLDASRILLDAVPAQTEDVLGVCVGVMQSARCPSAAFDTVLERACSAAVRDPAGIPAHLAEVIGVTAFNRGLESLREGNAPRAASLMRSSLAFAGSSETILAFQSRIQACIQRVMRPDSLDASAAAVENRAGEASIEVNLVASPSAAAASASEKRAVSTPAPGKSPRSPVPAGAETKRVKLAQE